MWRMEHLPIVPEQWKLIPKKETLKQFKVVEKLIKKADVLVNAGDPDREGQLLVDEVFGYLNLSAERKSQIQRCLVSDLNRMR
ncbi:DNA topoisomerase 3 [Mannheimia haemolytica]|uniref:DNA topoisomerase 3 n=1 Tax=Mannheimia haemolytica TaxID=75985 RepID=A0A378MYE0_MANHA|nr:DNA topoisomerase 3 [Mannheimia haemolytica]